MKPISTSSDATLRARFEWRDTPRESDARAGCRCEWTDDYMIATLSARCPIAEHRAARADWYRPRRIARELLRDVTGALKRLVFWGA